jgi:hypothetical protein
MVQSILQIPGCRPSIQIDNYNLSEVLALGERAKARERVLIRVNSLAPCETAAEFYSYIAYPDSRDAAERASVSLALTRWAILDRASLDKQWAETSMEPSVRPTVFSQTDEQFLQVFNRGAKILYRGGVVAFAMLMPHLLKDDLGDLSPTVTNVALRMASKIGYCGESQKTIESKVWGRIKPVAHAAAAYMFWLSVSDLVFESLDNNRDPLFASNPMLATMFYPKILSRIILPTAELLRLQLSSCGRFRIREENTIQFVAS